MSRVDDAVRASLALNPMGSIQRLPPIIRSTAAYAPPEVVDGKPPLYPYTPIKSSFEDAGSVEDMMLYTELEAAVHAMIQRLEYSFTFNPSLLTIPKRKQQVAEILKEAETYIWRIKGGNAMRLKMTTPISASSMSTRRTSSWSFTAASWSIPANCISVVWSASVWN